MRVLLWTAGLPVLLASRPHSPTWPVRGEGLCQELDEQQCSSLIQRASRNRKVPFASVELAGSLEGFRSLGSEASEAVAHEEPTAGSETPMRSPEVVPEPKASSNKLLEPVPLARPGANRKQHHALQQMHENWAGAAGWLNEHALDLLALSKEAFNDTGTKVSDSAATSWILIMVVIFLVVLGLCCLVPGPSYTSFLSATAKTTASQSREEPRAFFGMKMPTAPQSQLPTAGEVQSRSRPPTPPAARDMPLPAPRESVEAFLCPGLVVPSGCECTLSVPRLTPQFQPKLSRTTMSQVTIDDVKGVPVFRASFMLPSLGSPQSTAAAAPSNREHFGDGGVAAGGSRCLVLTSTTSESTIFAFCRDCRVELGFEPAALAIHNASGRPFGSLRPYRDQGAGGGFEVVTAGGFWVHLSANENGILTAIDRQGRSLAAAEPSAEIPGNRTVRIGPLVDAGLLTLSILAGDLMECALAEATPARSTHASCPVPGSERAWKL